VKTFALFLCGILSFLYGYARCDICHSHFGQCLKVMTVLIISLYGRVTNVMLLVHF